MYGFTVLFIKLSIIFLYRRIFAIDIKMERITLWLTGFLLIFYVAQICLAIVIQAECVVPPNPALCSNVYMNTEAQAVLNVATDFAVLVLPITRIFHLHMSLRRKLGISAVFAIGLL